MIWCVEDETSIRDIEVYSLESTGFEARGFEDGISFWNAIQNLNGNANGNGNGTSNSGYTIYSSSNPPPDESFELPELIVLDVMLPGIDGIELLRRLKASKEYQDIPVILATAKGAEYDKILGLDLGADYYLTKPFGVMELVSCVKAVLRRCSPKKDINILECGNLSINLNERSVSSFSKKVDLTFKEFELLRLFMSHPGMVFSREQIMDQVWGSTYHGETRTVDMHIRTLRMKLETAGSMIKTIRNVGYRLEVNE